MTFIRPGSRVRVRTDDVAVDIEGTVVRVQVGVRGAESYETIYWSDGLRYCEWLEPDEVEDVDEPR